MPVGGCPPISYCLYDFFGCLFGLPVSSILPYQAYQLTSHKMTKQVVQIPLANAVKAFKNADKIGKKLLSDLIGEDVLNANIMDRVKTLEDALELVPVSDEIATILAYKG